MSGAGPQGFEQAKRAEPQSVPNSDPEETRPQPQGASVACAEMGTADSTTGHALNWALLRKWWRVARIWFVGDEKWIARGYVAVVLGLALLTTKFYVSAGPARPLLDM